MIQGASDERPPFARFSSVVFETFGNVIRAVSCPGTVVFYQAHQSSDSSLVLKLRVVRAEQWLQFQKFVVLLG